MARLKYRNIPTVVDGIRFDSKAEARRWSELLLMERAGMITAIERQPVKELMVNGQRIGSYRGDFEYTDLEIGKRILEDVKSPATRTAVYLLKKKILEANGIEITEVMK